MRQRETLRRTDTPELNADEIIKAINHCYLFAGRNELRKAELLSAKKYINMMREKTKELDEELLSALIGLLKAAVSEMRDSDVKYLAVETQQAVANLVQISDYLQNLDFDDAA